MEQHLSGEQTEETLPCAEANTESGERAEAVSLKKFKDESSLQNAYKALESEFTKRCQKLKALEEENRLLKEAAETKDNSSAETENCGEWTDEDELNGFFEKYPEAQSLIREISAYVVGGDEIGKKGYMEEAYVRYLKDAFDKLKKDSSSEEYLLSHIEGTPIKEKIIRDYLFGVNNSNRTPLLLGDDGGIVLSPIAKPKNLQEASALAQKLIKII